MAKVTYSVLVATMSGKTGGAVFSRWKGTDYVRIRVTPSNPQSSLQTAQREAMANCLLMWQSIKSWAKAVWDPTGTAYGMSGYNAYVRDNIKHLKALTAGILCPPNRDYAPVSAHAIVAGAAGCMTVTWTDDDAHADDKVRVYYRKTETAAEEYAWTFDSSTAAATETVTVAGLDTGEEYEVAMFGHDSVDGAHAQAFNKILTCG